MLHFPSSDAQVDTSPGPLIQVGLFLGPLIWVGAPGPLIQVGMSPGHLILVGVSPGPLIQVGVSPGPLGRAHGLRQVGVAVRL